MKALVVITIYSSKNKRHVQTENTTQSAFLQAWCDSTLSQVEKFDATILAYQPTQYPQQICYVFLDF